jgi:hypothetical protein
MKSVTMKKGLTSMILIVLLLAVFAGLAIFLLGFMQTVSQKDYLNLYTHNLLLSIMRTDTGYTDNNCKLVSDLVSCTFFFTDWVCGDSRRTCSDIANETITGYMEEFELIKKNFRYLFSVETEGFVARNAAGEPLVFEVGDKSLKTSKIEKFTANERVLKVTTAGQQFFLKVQMILAPPKK